MMRVDYRYLRLVSVPFYVVAIVLLVLVFVPGLNIVVGGSARWLKLGPLPAIHPAEFAKLALVIYLAHWFAKRGQRRPRRSGRGTVPFLVIVAPVIALVFKEPDLGHDRGHPLTAFTMFFVAGANLVHLAVMAARRRAGRARRRPARLPARPDPGLAGPVARPARRPASTRSRACSRSASAACSGPGSASEPGVRARTPSTTSSSPRSARSSGWSAAIVVIALFLLLAYSGIRIALAAPDTFGALLAAGITAWLCLQAFINIGVVVALLPITGITLPFISAGGSSLIISFAAVGILLSISRETVEKGTWNDDATADRGRRDGRTHLPGARRRPVAPRSSADAA